MMALTITLASAGLLAFTNAHPVYKAKSTANTYWVFYDCSEPSNGILAGEGNYTDDAGVASSNCPNPTALTYCAREFNISGVHFAPGTDEVESVDEGEATGNDIRCE
ncbi:MAG: hypothetical protein ACO1NW_11880 [Chitinophagaceae bacterium]